LLASGVLVPILLWIYLRLQRASAVAPAGFKAKWLSHAPLVLVLLGLTCLCLALARPQAVMLTPMREATVMLAMDISGSMRAKDLEPSRFEAAKVAAERFIEDKPARLRVGLVTIAGTAALAQAPTDQRDDLLRALENLPLQYGSALGTGVLISLEALLPGANIDAQKIINEAMDGKPAKPPTQPVPSQPAPSANPAPQGRSMAIVLLSDGQGNMGPDLLAMAKLAAEHKVRIYTVGVGTPEGAIVQAQGRSMRVRLEEEMLRKVATETQGEYFRASSAQDLHKIYDQLGHRFRFEKRAVTEVTGAMAALGMLLALWGCLLSLHRYGRIL
jgi:Ca-activated chloride channel family protein